MANETDRLGIILETTSEGTGFQDVQGDFKKTEQEGKQSSENLEKSYQESFTKIRNASAIAFAAVGAAIGFAVREAAQGEQGMIEFSSSVRNAGGDADELSERLNTTAINLQRLTGIADDEFVSAASRMTDITGDASRSIENLSLVADFAVARKIDLASAADMVAKAMLGEIGMLSRLLPGLDDQILSLGENADKADIASVIFDRLAQFQGRAGDSADSTSGSINILKGEIGQTSEEIGNAFLPVVRAATEALTDMAKSAGEFARENPNTVVAIGSTTVATIGLIASFATITTAIPIVSSGMSAIGSAASVTTGLFTFQTVALWGNSLAWNAVGYAMLSVPGWGWAVAGVAALTALTIAISDFETEVEDTPQKVQDLEDAFDGLTTSASDATGVVRDFSHVTAEELEQAARDNMIPGLEDTTAAANDTADAVARIGKSPLVPLNLQINETIGSDPSGGFDEAAFREQQLQGQIALNDRMEADSAETQSNIQAQWMQSRESFLYHTSFLQNTYRSAIGTLADTEMTGRERREAIWGQFKNNVAGYIADVTARYIFGELAKRAATVATATVGVAASSTSAAVEVGNANKVTASWMAAAYAKLVAFYAFAGPFAPVLAVGTIGAAIAGVGAVIGAALGAVKLQEGGIVGGIGSGDRVPALLEPGERVISKSDYNANSAGIENAIAGGGGSGNSFHFHLNKDASTEDFLRIREMFEQWIVPTIERKSREGAFTMAGIPA